MSPGKPERAKPGRKSKRRITEKRRRAMGESPQNADATNTGVAMPKARPGKLAIVTDEDDGSSGMSRILPPVSPSAANSPRGPLSYDEPLEQTKKHPASRFAAALQEDAKAVDSGRLGPAPLGAAVAKAPLPAPGKPLVEIKSVPAPPQQLFPAKRDSAPTGDETGIQ